MAFSPPTNTFARKDVEGTMKTIIAGSRDITSDKVLYVLDSLNDVTEVISGGAKGPDSFGEQWGLSKGIPVKRFPANWNEYGKSAGMVRNIKMLEYADWLVAFWDGKSKGTKHIIDNAPKYGVKVVTILV